MMPGIQPGDTVELQVDEREAKRIEQAKAGDGHIDWPRVLAKGALAGIVATGALVASSEAIYRVEGEKTKAREREVRAGHFATPMQKPLGKLEERADLHLTKKQEEGIGRSVAWAMGIGGIMAYAVAREKIPAISAGKGLAFGAGAWLLEDELMVPLMTGTFAPTDYPWQAHARGLAAHLAYGVAAETTLDALDRVM